MSAYILDNFGVEVDSAEMPEGLRRQGFQPRIAYPTEWLNTTLGHHDTAYKAYLRTRMRKFYPMGLGAAVAGPEGGVVTFDDEGNAYVYGSGVYDISTDLGFVPTTYFSCSDNKGGYIQASLDSDDCKYSVDGGLTWSTLSGADARRQVVFLGYSHGSYYPYAVRRGSDFQFCHYLYLYSLGGGGYNTITNPTAYTDDNTRLASVEGSVLVSQIGPIDPLPFQVKRVQATGVSSVSLSIVYEAPYDAARSAVHCVYFKGYYWVSECFGTLQTLKCFKRPVVTSTITHLDTPDYYYEHDIGVTGTADLTFNENILVWNCKHDTYFWRARCFFHPGDYEDLTSIGAVRAAPHRLFYYNTTPGDAAEPYYVHMTELL